MSSVEEILAKVLEPDNESIKTVNLRFFISIKCPFFNRLFSMTGHVRTERGIETTNNLPHLASHWKVLYQPTDKAICPCLVEEATGQILSLGETDS